VFNRIIVPVDGSDAAWRAVVVGSRLATQSDATLELFHATDDPAAARAVERALHRRLVAEAIGPGSPSVVTEPQFHGAAATIADHFERSEGGLVVMSSHGHGRSAGILGNVATDVLRAAFGPIVVVGPNAKIDRPDFRGSILFAVDGSALSETALGVAGAWSIGLNAVPWVTTVIATGATGRHDTVESGYTHQIANQLERLTHRRVEFEVLHGGDPSLALADFAQEIDASLIVASTHGRTGVARLAFGSVTADIVRRAPCPVVLLRPPALPSAMPSATVAGAAGSR
jgi:nucleotide-binding universal stress UspA family protein